MLHLRALSRSACCLGLRLGRASAPASSPTSVALQQATGIATAGKWWKGLLDEYGGAATRLATSVGVSQDGEDKESGGRGVHTGRFLLKAQQQGSTFNNSDVTAREAGRPKSGGTGGAVADGSGGYTLLAAAHLGLAATCFVAPEAVANLFFPDAAMPQGLEAQPLVKMLGCGAGLGSATSLGLKQLADGGQLASPTAQRLQLGLMGFSTGEPVAVIQGAIALHALYSASISGTALLAGAATMGVTLLVPLNHYVVTNKGLKLGEAVTSYFGAVPDHFKVTGVQSGLYSLLTPVLALAGAGYLLAPGSTLAQVFGVVKGVDAYFWWQCIGAALMTVAPAATFSLKLADEGRLDQPVAKTLNAGVMATALGHLAVMGPIMASNQGGPALPWVVGAWATALATGGLGMFGGGAAKAAA
ncbi:hypothetical protein ACK3TF_000096 [Chlorella vulgaris]